MRKIAALLQLALLYGAFAFSQGTIRGKVLGGDGLPVPGASIQVKGTNTGTTAGSDGSFSLNVPSNSVTLVITAVEFQTLTVSAQVGKEVDARLTPTGANLEEVIVTGVAGATARKKMTVSVTKVGEERLKIVPATSAASALSGKVSGVRVNTQSGSPGGSIDVLLRGDNNLNVGSGPMILVDGVILNGSLTDINVDDIESMEVVKGAAAASLYGSRAGNGVIAITTKSGAKLSTGSTAVTVRNEVGFQSIQHYIDLAEHHAYQLSSDWQSYAGQFTKFQGVTYPADYKGGFAPGLTGSRLIDADHYLDNPFGVNINQQEEFFNTGMNYTNFVGIQSRSAKTNIYASFENNSQEGIIQFTNGYKRQNFRLNLDHQIAPWLKISARNLFINTKTQYPGDGGGIFFNIVLAEPDNNLKLPNPDGQPYLIRHNAFSNEKNPLYSVWKNERTDFTRRWIANYTANVKLANWVNVDLTHTIEIENYRYTNYSPYDTWILANGGTAPQWGMTYSEGSLYKYSDETNSQNTQVTVNMNHKFRDLRIQGKLSYLFEDKHYESFDVSASQFSYPNIPDFNNFDPTNPHSYSSSLQDVRARNYFAIAGFDFKDKFLLDAMGRYDGSSLFGSEERWHPYYRVSGAYRISQDVDIKGIDELKVRAAYGTAGIRPGYDWQYRYYQLSSGAASAKQQGNPNLKPSNTAETEVGINVEFLGKFYFEGTYAMSKTTDAFLEVPLIPFLNDGYSSQWRNAASLESKTLELTLGANWFRKKDISWNTNIVFSKTNQKITRLDVPPYLSGPDGLFYIKQGEKYGAIYGYTWVRSLAQMGKQLPSGGSISDYEVNSDGYVVPAGSQGTANEKPIKLKDENGNLAFVEIGNGNPDFIMGVSNTFNYKGFQLYLLVDIKKGGDVYNRKSQWLTRDSRNGIMDMANVPDAQKKTFDYYQGFYDVNTNNAYWVEDAGFIKLREVAFGYSVSPKALAAFKGVVRGITARIVGRNLLTFTDYSGYDPEVGSIRNPFDGTGTYPNYRNLAFSLTLEF